MEKEYYIKITDQVRTLIAEVGTCTVPPLLAQKRLELTTLSSNLSEALDEILAFKGTKLEEWRTETGSVAGAKSKWGACKEGQQEVWLRGWLNRIKNTNSSIKTRLDIYRDQNFNQF